MSAPPRKSKVITKTVVEPETESEDETDQSPPRATKEQLHALKALTAGMVAQGQANTGRRRKTKMKLAQEGRHIMKTFLASGVRPSPSNGIFDGQVYIAELMATVPTVVFTSTSISVFSAFNFNLSVYDNYTMFTTMFDQYKIMQVEVWIETGTANDPNLGHPTLTTCLDFDDNTPPTTFAKLSGRPSSITAPASQGRYYKFVPHVAVAEYAAGLFTSYGNVPATWIDTNSPAVAHYGMKLAVAPTTSVQSILVSYRAVVGFKGITGDN